MPCLAAGGSQGARAGSTPARAQAPVGIRARGTCTAGTAVPGGGGRGRHTCRSCDRRAAWMGRCAAAGGEGGRRERCRAFWPFADGLPSIMGGLPSRIEHLENGNRGLPEACTGRGRGKRRPKGRRTRCARPSRTWARGRQSRVPEGLGRSGPGTRPPARRRPPQQGISCRRTRPPGCSALSVQI